MSRSGSTWQRSILRARGRWSGLWSQHIVYQHLALQIACGGRYQPGRFDADAQRNHLEDAFKREDAEDDPVSDCRDVIDDGRVVSVDIVVVQRD
eukprot:3377088-Rhodomonas_salina.1